MRKGEWLVVAVLAAVAASGCRMGRDPDGCGCGTRPGVETRSRLRARQFAMPVPGVVEIYRADNGVVGYMCHDDDDPKYTWWLLDQDEEPPVTPHSQSIFDDVSFDLLTDRNRTKQQLCDEYGGFLDHPKIWHVNRGDAEDCVKSGGARPDRR